MGIYGSGTKVSDIVAKPCPYIEDKIIVLQHLQYRKDKINESASKSGAPSLFISGKLFVQLVGEIVQRVTTRIEEVGSLVFQFVHE